MMFWYMMCLAGLLFLLYGERLEDDAIKWAAKPVASLGFLAAALSEGASASSYGTWVIVALLFSWFGDVLLIPRGAKKWFRLGLGAFLLGHVAYVGAFLARGIVFWGFGVALLALSAVAYGISRWLLPQVGDRLKAPVVAYIAVITLMVAAAISTTLVSPDWRILVAALMFYVSDLFVARQRFVKAGYINRLLGLPLYYVAQLLFAWSTAT